MKTKVLVFAALFFGGLLFTSCQKDNALFEGDAMLKSEFQSEVDPIGGDPMRNYPDPFLNTTVIEYRLAETAWVRISVHNHQTGYVKLLNEGIQVKGLHAIKFEAHKLPAGNYTAELEVGNKVYRENMYKKGFETAEDIQDESPEE